MHAEWRSATEALSVLHRNYSASLRVASLVVGPVPASGAVRFSASPIRDLEVAPVQHEPHGFIATEDVRGALAAMFEPPAPIA